SILQLLLPLLTQAIVDFGINNQDLQFITLILIGQLTLYVSQTGVQFIQSWILLHVSTRINVAFVSAFLMKLMRLPLSFFDAKLTGDLLQRIGDHRRVELFLTTTAMGLLFSFVTFVVFGLILLFYSPWIFLLFMVGSALYFGWLVLFLRRRAVIDQQRFDQLAENQNALIEIIQGMPEIKLQNSSQKHRWAWATIQARLFRANIRALRLTQYQDAGASLITQIKDLLITFLAARSVVQGEMTLGMLLAVQYIVGQLNGPLLQWVQFIRTAQDARLSLDRLGEIHAEPEEEEDRAAPTLSLPADLRLDRVSFRYNPLYDPVLKEVSCAIPAGKVTAIVGASGSGKTTFLKLLLGIYAPEQGRISVAEHSLSNLPGSWWRDQCGTVLQDGYLFSKSIAENIAEHDQAVDIAKVQQAIKIACLDHFVEQLPNGLHTMVGARGNGLSQGQYQRLLIARAVYKDPTFLFFDEATNALDTLYEAQIMKNLEAFFAGRTVILAAHRLSTVKKADQILVLQEGELVEQGTHAVLLAQKGTYYQLIQEQLNTL
ncbi:MAG: ABC transporter transmembrane domain-containing protein, partial [Bacteroidota bacterium]